MGSIIKYRYLLLMGGLFALLLACNKQSDFPGENPYNSIVYETPKAPVDTTQKSSLVWLQREVFSARCAVPGCHDGNFEPDFRSLSSTFSTLVYHPVVKNDSSNSFVYRVVPYDTANSVLHERITNCCFVNINDRMPQDVIGEPLQDSLVEAIAAWILNGAPDMFGNVAPFPDKKPTVEYFVAINTTYTAILSGTDNRIDSVYYNPFIMPHATPMYIGVFLKDDATAISDMVNNRLITSYSPTDFSPSAAGYRVYTPTFVSLSQDAFWQVSINTGDYSKGNTVYMRYYTNDGEHTVDVEMPNEDLPAPYSTFWSFYILP